MRRNKDLENAILAAVGDSTKCGNCGIVITNTPWYLTYVVDTTTSPIEIVDFYLGHAMADKGKQKCRPYQLGKIFHLRGWKQPQYRVFPINPCEDDDLYFLEEILCWKPAIKALFETMKQHLEAQCILGQQTVIRVPKQGWVIHDAVDWLEHVKNDNTYMLNMAVARGVFVDENWFDVFAPGITAAAPPLLIRAVHKHGIDYVLEAQKRSGNTPDEFIRNLLSDSKTYCVDDVLETFYQSKNVSKKPPTV